eukprot:gene29884-4514_t
MMRSLLLAVLGLAVAVSADKLVDFPIAADAVTYLDGTWTATAAGTTSGKCTFTEGQDWTKSGGGPSGTAARASTRQDCCDLCAQEPACVKAVFIENNKYPESCWLKEAADIAGGAVKKSGVVSCSKVSSTPSPPAFTIKAKVPGDLITDLQTAALVGDPLYELNFKNATMWDSYVWTY